MVVQMLPTWLIFLVSDGSWWREPQVVLIATESAEKLQYDKMHATASKSSNLSGSLTPGHQPSALQTAHLCSASSSLFSAKIGVAVAAQCILAPQLLPSSLSRQIQLAESTQSRPFRKNRHDEFFKLHTMSLWFRQLTSCYDMCKSQLQRTATTATFLPSKSGTTTSTAMVRTSKLGITAISIRCTICSILPRLWLHNGSSNASMATSNAAPSAIYDATAASISAASGTTSSGSFSAYIDTSTFGSDHEQTTRQSHRAASRS